MYKVGLTGGIGSGKSSVAKIFRSLGLPVYDTDKEAKVLIEKHPKIRTCYKSLFGDDIYTEMGLNRAKVAKIVFNDSFKLKELEKVVHPIVFKHFVGWCSLQNSNIVIKENAILFESGGAAFLDDIITISAPLELRVERVMKRDGVSAGDVMARVNKQWSDDKKIALSKYVIYADDTVLVTPQVIALVDELKAEAPKYR